MARIKWLLPLVAVLLIAVGVFAMNARKNTTKMEKSKPATTYRWFKISGSYNPTAGVLPSDAAYIQTSEMPPEEEDCDGNKHQCVSGFDASQTVPSGGSSYVLNGTQAPNPSASNVLKN